MQPFSKKNEFLVTQVLRPKLLICVFEYGLAPRTPHCSHTPTALHPEQPTPSKASKKDKTTKNDKRIRNTKSIGVNKHLSTGKRKWQIKVLYGKN